MPGNVEDFPISRSLLLSFHWGSLVTVSRKMSATVMKLPEVAGLLLSFPLGHRSLLVLLVLGDQIIHVAFRFRELHLIHTFASVPM